MLQAGKERNGDEILVALEFGEEPLKAQSAAEGAATMVIPSAESASIPDEVWVGQPLLSVLTSARREGENALAHLELLEREVADFGGEEGRLPGLFSAEQIKAQEKLGAVQRTIQDAWQELRRQTCKAIDAGRVGESIGPLVGEFYRQVTATMQELRSDPVWARLRRDTHPEIPTTPTYPIHTGEEWRAFLQAASDGKELRHYIANTQTGTLRHQRPNAAFFTETSLLDEEQIATGGLEGGIELLKDAASALDIDDGLAWLYISHLLAPPAPLPPNAASVAWIDLDDVARKTMGGYAPNPAEAARRRAKVWHAIRYGARAHIGGQRSVPYYDKNTGRQVETEIYTTPWQIASRQDELPSLFPTDKMPLRVELAASRQWTAITTAPDTAQYLPFGEIIGQFPANQPGGAWARVLGLAYCYWCRSHLHDALTLRPASRRELLDQYEAKNAPYREILASPNPGRARTYWTGAESFLREAGIIELIPDDALPLPRKGWQELWLSAQPPWRPGPLLQPILTQLAAKKFAPQPRALGSTRRRRTRPNPQNTENGNS